MCNNDAVPYSGIWPAILSRLTEKKIAGLRVFGVDFFQAVNAGGDANEYGVGLSAYRVPQLASIPKTKRQAALQPTHNGSDDAKWQTKPRQRTSNGSRIASYVLVNLVPQNTKFANCVKRLVPYSKKAFSPRPYWVREGKLACL